MRKLEKATWALHIESVQSTVFVNFCSVGLYSIANGRENWRIHGEPWSKVQATSYSNQGTVAFLNWDVLITK